MHTVKDRHRGRKGITFGLITIALGVVWLLKRLGLVIPDWVLDWPMILIYIGLAIGIGKGFRNPAAWILLLIGGVNLLTHTFDIFIPFEIREIFWPVMVIIIGLVIVFRPRKSRFRDGFSPEDDRPEETSGETGYAYPGRGAAFERDTLNSIESVSIFNGIKKFILSKNFKGGETVTVFGGTEINLLQADFDRHITLDNVVVFGGLKLIVPPNWDVQINTTNILAGTEDKRVSAVQVIPENKVLTLTGVVVFGGIDIVSY